MAKYWIIFLVISSFHANAQSTLSKDTSEIFSLSALDSLLLNIDSANKPSSYVYFTIGIGNKEFSQTNNAINSTQSNVSQLFYTPSISYFHKSGFSISLSPYITFLNNKAQFYQTAIRPSYSFSNKKFGFTADYTHYFAGNKAYNSNSIFQNEIFASVKYKKYFLKPALSVGFATGNYNEINIDTLRTFPQLKLVKDSTNNTIKDFSVSLSVGHSFEFEKFLFKNDLFTFTPELILSSGSERFTTTHVNKIFARLITKSKKVRSLTANYNEQFAIQSLALSLSADYEIGKFTISPNVYFDYYLPTTTGKRLNTVYSISVGYSF